MSDTRELRAVLTVVDGFTRPINDFNKKISDITKSATKIPIRAEDQATAEVKRVMGSVDKLQKVAQQPLRVTIQDFISANIAKIALKLEALRLKGIIPVGMSTGLAAVGMAAGGIAIAGAVAGMGMLAASSVTVAAGFEQSMAKVASVVGGTGEEAIATQHALSKAAREAGATSVFSASQAAEAEYFLASSGMNVQQITAALGDTLQFAASGGLELGRAAEITTGVLAQYGAKAEETARYTNVMAATAAKSNTDINQLGEAFTMVGPVAGALGISIEQTSAALGVLANAGFKSTMGGTALRGILSDLMNTTPIGTERLKSYGIALTDLNPQTHSLVDIITLLEQKQVNAADIMKIWGDRAGPGLLAMLKQGHGALVQMQTDITGTSKASEMAKKQTETYEGAMRMWASAVEEVQIIIGSAFLPIMTKVVNIMSAILVPISKVIDVFAVLIDAIPGMNWALIVTGTTLVASVISTLLIPAISGLILKYDVGAKASLVFEMWTNILGKAFSWTAIKTGLMTAATTAYSIATKAATAATAAMNAVAMVNPYVLIAVAVVALVAAIGYLLYKTGYLQKAWDKFKNSAIGKDLIGGIVAGVAWVTTAFSSLFDWLNKQWADMSSGAGTGLLGVLGSVMGALGGVFDKIDKAYASGDLGKLVMNVAMGAFPVLLLLKPILLLYDVIKNTVVWILEKLLVVFEWAVNLWKKAVAFLDWLYESIKGGLKWIKDGLGITKAEKQQKVTDIASKAGLHQENGVWWKDNVKADHPESGVPRETLARLKKAEEDVAKAPTGIFEGIPGISDLTNAINDLKSSLAQKAKESVINPVQKITEQINPTGTAAEKKSAEENDAGGIDFDIGTGMYFRKDTGQLLSDDREEALKLAGSYASGTDYVPQTGPYILHQGERVVPASQNKGHGVTNIVVNASAHIDKIASDFDVRKLENMMKRAALTAVKDALSQRRT